MASEPVPLSGLARRLVEENILDADSAIRSTEEARKEGTPFVAYLVSNGLAESRTIAVSASEEFGVPLLDLSAFDVESIPKDLVKDNLIRQHNALPLVRRGMRLFVAVSDPTNLQALDEIKFQTGVNTEAVLVEEDKLQTLIEQFLNRQDENALGDLGDDDLEDLDMEAMDDADDDNEVDPRAATDDTPVVRFVNKMLLDAIKSGASDIHFEPYEKTYRVRFRTDGILHVVATPPSNLGTRLAARLKVMSELDISERRVPQDGRIKMKLSKTRAIDFRVNTLPTLWGEKIVLRILDPGSAKMGIEALGFEDDQQKYFLEALARPQGMILVTGPTGSGKTVSLYTGLNILNTAERNIATAEDPVEINLEGINQVNVNNRVGLDFASALRSFLRQDPDVVMVGEIRDLETAEIAIKAAQTGHLVLSTLHTNSAAETLTRLRNMGVPAFNLATSVALIIAQRLARRLCPNCKRTIDVPKETLEAEGFTEEQISRGFEVYEANPDGCAKCKDGYKGRVGIYEVVKITREMSRIIMEDGNSLELAQQARELGFNDLRASGLEKVIQGVTSLVEVNRVTTGH
ncbi:MAG: type IV-A pilus assembly ATPase PilB [Gammaproteobacteria bacterium]|nr:type IV-A pilus assembly ATPase PilB [Gammaproteobacteria bacterium]|tara:strand:+ start:772 stop:2499 length:1728 start_codon:yes stop_codon:yes gene_type:complete